MTAVVAINQILKVVTYFMKCVSPQKKEDAKSVENKLIEMENRLISLEAKIKEESIESIKEDSVSEKLESIQKELESLQNITNAELHSTSTRIANLTEEIKMANIRYSDSFHNKKRCVIV